jgi:hypothetical protein
VIFGFKTCHATQIAGNGGTETTAQQNRSEPRENLCTKSTSEIHTGNLAKQLCEMTMPGGLKITCTKMKLMGNIYDTGKRKKVFCNECKG